MPREFRAAWIATVANVDWPSRPGLPAALQQRELRTMLDRCVALNLNAVILQVRPHGDAIYPSELEPWTAYLSGSQGQAPAPTYDPLAFAIEEAHARGLELHAWFNPFRASHPSDQSPRDRQHFASRYPEHVVRYGKYEWMDPSSDAVHAHAIAVVCDVVRRYDIDGVHMDDYFYPYPIRENGRAVPFPDANRHAAYRQAGGTLELSDWRRDNVNRFVQRLYASVKAIDPGARVGISPFGIWRPGHPASVKGLDAFDAIYADARHWLQQGWVDYLAPQLYWASDAPEQAFEPLLRWWIAQSTDARPIWPGLAAYRMGDASKGFGTHELTRQIRTVRSLSPTVPGFFLFSAKVLIDEAGPAYRDLTGGVLADQTLPPISDGVGATPVGLAASASADAAELWVHVQSGAAAGHRWVVQYENATGWHHAIVPADRSHVRIPHHGAPPVEVWVRALGDAARLGPAARAEVVSLDGPTAPRLTP